MNNGISSNWVDVSIPYFDGMVNWPGDAEVKIRRVANMDEGDENNVTRLDMSVHTGTHMDAPLHFIADGVGMEAWTPEATIGECRVIVISDPVCVTAAELETHEPLEGERLLIKTRNSVLRHLEAPVFYRDFVYIAEDAAKLLADRKVRTVGVDYFSVGGFYKDGKETHLAILGAGIWVIEGVDLASVMPGAYEMNCMPLKIRGADGSPARVLLRPV